MVKPADTVASVLSVHRAGGDVVETGEVLVGPSSSIGDMHVLLYVRRLVYVREDQGG
jgi:hypothetical protein